MTTTEANIRLSALADAWGALALLWGGDDSIPDDVRRAFVGLRRSVWKASQPARFAEQAARNGGAR